MRMRGQLITAALVLGAAWTGAALVDAQAPVPRAANKAMCANNLKQLFTAMHIYVNSFGRGSRYPPHDGAVFWACLAGRCGGTDRHSRNYADRAPLSGAEQLLAAPGLPTPSGGVDYAGPRRHAPEGEPSALCDNVSPDTVIACDRKGNHPDGGHVLRFDGSVVFLSGDDYEKALLATQYLPSLSVTIESDADRQAPPAGEVEALLKQLGDDAYAKREDAQRKLEALGPSARPALAKASESPDPEIRTRAGDLLTLLSGSRVFVSKGADGGLRIDGHPAGDDPPRVLIDRLGAAAGLSGTAKQDDAPVAPRGRVIVERGEGVDAAALRAVLEACARREPGLRLPEAPAGGQPGSPGGNDK